MRSNSHFSKLFASVFLPCEKENSITKVILMKTELVTTLKRQATKILSNLRKDRSAILITEHGKPAAYLVDVDTYEAKEKRMCLLEGLARGEKAYAEGRFKSHKEAKVEMSRWLK
jgi:prevent-host-death family protein